MIFDYSVCFVMVHDYKINKLTNLAIEASINPKKRLNPNKYLLKFCCMIFPKMGAKFFML
jgi:hypothetical protein